MQTGRVAHTWHRVTWAGDLDFPVWFWHVPISVLNPRAVGSLRFWPGSLLGKRRDVTAIYAFLSFECEHADAACWCAHWTTLFFFFHWWDGCVSRFHKWHGSHGRRPLLFVLADRRAHFSDARRRDSEPWDCTSRSVL